MRRNYTSPTYVDVQFAEIDVLNASANDGFVADIQWREDLLA